MTFARQTLSSVIELEGWGLHSGVPVKVRLLPGSEGIRFLYGAQIVPALPEQVSETTRCTKLGPISTVEHLMAALAGAEITDVDVEVSQPELPALDGSALPYLEAIRSSGPLESLGELEIQPPFSRIFVHEENAKLAISSGNGEWRYEFSTSGRWPGEQAYETLNVHENFSKEVAPARTFGFESEVASLQAMGLAKGLDLEKALLIGESGYANVARFDNEPARHKLLDAIGDLYLAGIPIRFLNVVAERTGHRMNVQAAHRLRQAAFGQ